MTNLFGDIFSGIEEESNSYDLLPPGNYSAMVDGAEIKKTKNGTGFYINMKYKLCDNEKYNNKVVFDIVNIKNDNEKAQEIGRGRLKRLLSLSGVAEGDMEKTSPATLIGKKFNIYIKHDKQEGYDTKEKIASISEFKKVDNRSVLEQQKEAGNIPASWV